MTSTGTENAPTGVPLTSADLAAPIELPEVGGGTRRSRRRGGRRKGVAGTGDAAPAVSGQPGEPLAIPAAPQPTRSEPPADVPAAAPAAPVSVAARVAQPVPASVPAPAAAAAHATPASVPAPPETREPATAPTWPAPSRYVHEDEPRPGPRSALVLVASIVIMVAAIVLLAWVVYDRLVDAPDPEPAPAAVVPAEVVEPRPRVLVVNTDADGGLVGVTIAALTTGGQGGSVVLVPPSTMLEIPGATLQRLDQAAAESGPEVVRLALENLIGSPFAALVVVEPTDWIDLLGDQQTVTVENPAPLSRLLVDGSTQLVQPAGPIDVAPAEIPALLAEASPGEDALDRLVRHQRVWESWLAAVARPGVPGADAADADNGDLAAFAASLGSGPVDYRILPVDLVDAAAGMYTIDDAEAGEVLDAIAPERHGVAAPKRVQLLNGVGTPGLAGAVASVLVPRGLSVPLTDNAERFGYATTQIVYYRPEAAGTASQVRDLLGVGEVVKSRSVLDAVDVTVVIGEDLAATLEVGPSTSTEPQAQDREAAGA